MPEQTDVEEPSPKTGLTPPAPEAVTPEGTDLLAARSHLRSAGLLVVVVGLFWIIFQYGPRGANWIGDRAGAVIGVTPAERGMEPVGEGEKTVPESRPDAPRAAGDPRLSHARKVILEALGGPEKVEVQHIAISTDGESMVAAVRFFGEDGTARLEEIFFELDEFQRYVSTEDAPLQERIKIWKPE